MWQITASLKWQGVRHFLKEIRHWLHPLIWTLEVVYLPPAQSAGLDPKWIERSSFGLCSPSEGPEWTGALFSLKPACFFCSLSLWRRQSQNDRPAHHSLSASRSEAAVWCSTAAVRGTWWRLSRWQESKWNFSPNLGELIAFSVSKFAVSERHNQASNRKCLFLDPPGLIQLWEEHLCIYTIMLRKSLLYKIWLKYRNIHWVAKFTAFKAFCTYGRRLSPSGKK